MVFFRRMAGFAIVTLLTLTVMGQALAGSHPHHVRHHAYHHHYNRS